MKKSNKSDQLPAVSHQPVFTSSDQLPAVSHPLTHPISDRILYKNNQLIAVDKPAGIPTQPDKTQDKSLIDLMEIYCKSSLHLIHRLDRTASGIVLFAKTKNALKTMNDQFLTRSVQKTYLAIVGVRPPKEEDTLVHHLQKNEKANTSTAHNEETKHTKRAELHYKIVAQSDNYTLLEINLLTGRHHQIRAQLSAIGSPIKGDVKYGFRRSNPDRSIHLHAWKLSFNHPVSKERIHLESPPPQDPLWDFFFPKVTSPSSDK